MTNDNQDALRCAEYLDGLADEIDHTHFTDDVRGSAAHLRRLVRENEALRESVKKANEQAEHFEREWYLRGDQIEAKDALLRQAVGVFDGLFGTPDHWTGAGGGGVAVWRTGGVEPVMEAIAAIRQHLEGRA